MQSRLDTEARIAVAQAADIARELGHPEVGPDHLLLGLLANARGTAYSALTDHGLRLETAREIVAAQHVDRLDRPDLDAEDADPAATSYDDDREALRAIGIDLDRVRDAVRTNLGQDLTDGWASRPDRDRTDRDARGGRRGRRRQHHDHPITTITTRVAAVVAPAADAVTARASRASCGACCATCDAQPWSTASTTTAPPGATTRACRAAGSWSR